MVTSSIGSSRSPFALGLEQHARTADRDLEAFAAHRLDQHAELQFAAARDLERAVARLADLDRDIALGLAQEALADHAALHLVALAAGEREVVHRHRHRQGRRIDRIGVDRLAHGHVAERVGDGGDLKTRDGDDVAGFGARHRHARQPAEREQLGHARALDLLAVIVQHLDDAVDGHRAGSRCGPSGCGRDRDRPRASSPAW